MDQRPAHSNSHSLPILPPKQVFPPHGYGIDHPVLNPHESHKMPMYGYPNYMMPNEHPMEEVNATQSGAHHHSPGLLQPAVSQSGVTTTGLLNNAYWPMVKETHHHHHQERPFVSGIYMQKTPPQSQSHPPHIPHPEDSNQSKASSIEGNRNTPDNPTPLQVEIDKIDKPKVDKPERGEYFQTKSSNIITKSEDICKSCSCGKSPPYSVNDICPTGSINNVMQWLRDKVKGLPMKERCIVIAGMLCDLDHKDREVVDELEGEGVKSFDTPKIIRPDSGSDNEMNDGLGGGGDDDEDEEEDDRQKKPSLKPLVSVVQLKEEHFNLGEPHLKTNKIKDQKMIKKAKKAHHNSQLVKHSICKFCSKDFTTSFALKIHMSVHTGNFPFKCKYCQKGFTSRKHMVSHERRQHTGERPFKCKECNKAFTLKTTLQKHLLIHSGTRPYQCRYCPRAFVQHQHRSRHELIHKDEKPYTCSICDKGFRQPNALRNHVMVHTNEKPHICQYCSKAFRHKGSLHVHERTHTGVRPYICSHCGKTFNCKSNLRAHIRSHTGEGHVCPKCGKQFSQKRALTQHDKMHHSEARESGVQPPMSRGNMGPPRQQVEMVTLQPVQEVMLHGTEYDRFLNTQFPCN